MRWLVLLALSGCALVASSRDVESPGSVHVVDEVAGPPGVIALQVTESYGTLHIDATRPRYCYRETRQFIAHRERTAAGLLAPDAIIFATSVANALDSESTIEDRTLSVTRRDCSVPASRVRVEVVLPTGAVVRAVADADGLAHVKIPVSEPARGVAVVRAGYGSTPVPYER